MASVPRRESILSEGGKEKASRIVNAATRLKVVVEGLPKNGRCRFIGAIHALLGVIALICRVVGESQKDGVVGSHAKVGRD